MRLRTQISLIIFPLVIIPLTWIGWLIFNQLLEEINLASKRQMTGAITQIEKSLQQLENTAKNNINLFASSQIFQKYIKTENEDDRYLMQQPLLIKRFSEYQLTYPEYYKISFITPKGFIDTSVSLKEDLTPPGINHKANYIPVSADTKRATIRYAKENTSENVALHVYKSLYSIDRSIDPDKIDHSTNPNIWMSKHQGFLSISISIDKIISEIRQYTAENNVAMVLLNEQFQNIASTYKLASADKLPEVFLKARKNKAPIVL